MYNQAILVGRIINIEEKGNDTINVIVEVSKSDNDKDYIPATLKGGLASNTLTYCKKGNRIGIKGKLATNEDKQLIVVAEKVTFLSSQEEKGE